MHSATDGPPHVVRPPSRLPGLLYGLGLGGFVDGIVLHQVLQWHHMVSSTEDHPMTTLAGLEVNTLADGFFHVVIDDDEDETPGDPVPAGAAAPSE